MAFISRSDKNTRREKTIGQKLRHFDIAILQAYQIHAQASPKGWWIKNYISCWCKNF